MDKVLEAAAHIDVCSPMQLCGELVGGLCIVVGHGLSGNLRLA